MSERARAALRRGSAGALLGGAAGAALHLGSLRPALARVAAEGWLGHGAWRLAALELGEPALLLAAWTLAGLAAGAATALRGRAPAAPSRAARAATALGLGWALAAAAAAGGALALARADAGGRPHVLWITIDALRADHVGCYGYERDTSPFLDRLAGEGVRFARAVSQESYTMASVASYFTSTYPAVNGVLYDEPEIDVLGYEFQTLAEELRGAGYDTAAFVFNPHLKATFRFDQGFETYDDRGPAEEPGASPDMPVWEYWETVERMRRRVEGFLDERERRGSAAPVFLYLHYRDVHGPYVPPPELCLRFVPDDVGEEVRARIVERALLPVSRAEEQHEWSNSRDFVASQYDASILYTDRGIEELLELLERRGVRAAETLLLVTADHGEELRDLHPEDAPGFGHGRAAYMEQIHVPLIARFPAASGIGGGRVVERAVELLDLAPTVLDAAGLPPCDAFQGRSLLPLLSGDEAPHRPVFSGGNRGRGVVIDGDLVLYSFDVPTKMRWRYYASRPEPDEEPRRGKQLFDLAGDPAQRRDLKHERADVAERLESAHLLPWILRTSGRRAATAELDEETRAHLRELGYLGD